MTGRTELAAQIGSLYHIGCGHDHSIELAAGDSFFNLPSFIDIPSLVEKALSRIFESKKADVDPDLFEITYSALDEAVTMGFGTIQYGQPNFEFAEHLRSSAALFSAKKTWAQATELAQLAIKENGHQRSWKEFRELAKPIVQDYNETWLKAEFNTAVRAARSAKEWKQYEENADLYPNLRYLASRAATPRDEHKKYYGITLPIMHDFWVHHLPPLDWNCLCGHEQTDEPEVEYKGDGPKVSKGLDNNPGLTGKLFSDSHPYNEGLTGNEKDNIAEKAKEYVTRRNEKRRQRG